MLGRKCFIGFTVVYLLVFLGCVNRSNEIKKLAEDIYPQKSLKEPLPPRIFRSDGCSCFPDGDWIDCCVEHDLAYWVGGSREERKNADLELRKCVEGKGHPIIAQIMYHGLRIGGVWWLPTSFRWGFGWDYPQNGPPGKQY